eukprot:gnl/TRDRNA2_/TRDRNA2_176971_c0_seq1.p2 gnl/TRDRNA2_/TRDRNA2_176971_c0~~gnl/TRDRNA2_/TRDRNA2_176971_c0_seq1.p2  ORF type:complete len:209 (-),score=0.42 gnl/TRDRNA2_/TRDRNA2_176971_c0_seq1:2294-2920(-)
MKEIRKKNPVDKRKNSNERRSGESRKKKFSTYESKKDRSVSDDQLNKKNFNSKKKNSGKKSREKYDENETKERAKRHEEDFARNEKYREMRELERATRTVFVGNLHIKVNEKDLFILFSQKAGKVIDIYLICDKHTNKSKGLAYVELENIESMAIALQLSGIEMYGQSIQVRPSEMEKKRSVDFAEASSTWYKYSYLCNYSLYSNARC